MAGSTLGTVFSVSTWGESHGKGVGVVIDGCPAGLSLSSEDIQLYLNRRKPGQSRFTTPRKEDDAVEILSGVFEGKTTGTPISLVVYNCNQKSKDYSEIAAGAVAANILKELGITLTAYTKSIGDISISTLDLAEIANNALYMPDADAAAKASAYLDTCMQEHDSSGGVIECIIDGMPAGIGEPVFDKLDANLAKAIFSIGAVKGFEIGDGFLTSFAKGSENNDAFFYDENGNVCKKTNHAGGILGGMSDGAPIVLRAAVKPTPSIFKAQQTVNRSGENITLEIKGRHDPVIVPRAVVVVESMAALVLVDALMENMSSRLEHMIEFYNS